jgi:hypothetical protein
MNSRRRAETSSPSCRLTGMVRPGPCPFLTIMKRNDPEFDGLFAGEEGLWAAVLLNILEDIEDPKDRAGREQARRIVMEPGSGCLPFIANALGISIGQLQKKIIRYLKKRRAMITKE